MGKVSKDNNILEESLIEYQNIEKMIEKSSTNQIKDIFSEAIKKELKNIIAESTEDEDDVEEQPQIDGGEGEGLEDTSLETGIEGDKTEDEPDFEEEPEEDFTGEEGEGMDADSDVEADGEEDFQMDQFKTGEDEYDLTNSNIEDVVKVFKRINDNDSVIVKKLDNGKIELNDKETGADYLIDLDGENESEEAGIEGDEFDEGDDVDGVDEGEKIQEEQEDDTDDYSMNESEIEIELDGGEDEIEEKNMTQSIGTNRRAGRMTQTRKANAPGVNNRDGAKLIANEAKKISIEYQEKVKKIAEKYESKLKEINEEVEQYKKTLIMFRDKLKENAVLNNNLAKYVKLVTENATTKDEKLEILKRFSNEANTIEAGNKLFESINETLNKKTTPNIDIDKQFNAPTKQKVNEQVIYQQNDDLNRTIDLMKRINSL